MSLRIGCEKEALAIDYLRQLGFTIIARNYRIKQGEIDVVCIDRDTLVFVEVKYRSSDDCGKAVEYVRPYKVKRILKAAWHYIENAARPLPENYRIDVVAIDGEVITYYKNIPID